MILRGIPVAEKRNRWLINVVLALATTAFIGISIVPLLQSFSSSAPQATPSPVQSVQAPKADLAARARGYEEVLKREPENQTALKGLLESKLQLNDIKGAVEPLEKLAALNPTNTQFSVLLAQAKQQLGDREAAAQVYRKILKSQPGDLNALSGLADLFISQKRPEAAISLLQDTLKQAPNQAQVGTQAGSVDTTAVQVLLGKVYAKEKRLDDAIAAFDQAIKRSPNDFQAVLYKGLALKQQGKPDAAKPLFEQAIALAPAQYKDQIRQMASSATPAPSSPANSSASGSGSNTPNSSPSPSPANASKN